MSISTMPEAPVKTLEQMGLPCTHPIHYQLSQEELTAQAVQREEGVLNNTGALIINTGEFTGRSPQDKFTVKDELTQNVVDWNDFNLPIEAKYFDRVYKKLMQHLGQNEIFVRDSFACADPKYRLNI